MNNSTFPDDTPQHPSAEAPKPTDPGDITFSLVKRWKDEVRALAKDLFTPTEKHVLVALAEAIKVRPKHHPADDKTGKWSIPYSALAKRAGCSIPTAKRAIPKAMRLGIVKQLWRGHNFNGDPKKAKASGYTLELPSVVQKLDPVAWDDAVVAVKSKKRKPMNKGDMREELIPLHDTHGSIKMIPPYSSRKYQERSHGSISADTLYIHNSPLVASQTARFEARPVRYAPREIVEYESRCEKDNPQHRGSSPASSSADGFLGSSASGGSARSEPRTFQIGGDHPTASSLSPSEAVDQTANILDAASPEEDSPLVPLISEVDLPFEVMLDLAARFGEIDETGLDAAQIFFARAPIVKKALIEAYGLEGLEAEYFGSLVGPIVSLMGAPNAAPPPISYTEFALLSCGPAEDDAPIFDEEPVPAPHRRRVIVITDDGNHNMTLTEAWREEAVFA